MDQLIHELIDAKSTKGTADMRAADAQQEVDRLREELQQATGQVATLQVGAGSLGGGGGLTGTVLLVP